MATKKMAGVLTNDDSSTAATQADGGDWRPTAAWPQLELRAKLLRRVRSFFEPLGFLEVETPLLSAETVVDRQLDPIPVVQPNERGNSDPRMWLQTSPELAMKRLLATMADDPTAPRAIYQITRSFRAAEQGPLHNPEFTLVEWYRLGDAMQQGMDLLSDLADALLSAGAADRVSYRDAFLEHAEIDPLTAKPARLARLAATLDLAVPAGLSDDVDQWLDLLMLDVVMPRLGHQRPVILYDYPATQAALAQVRDDDPPVAERFEMIYRGIELANGYHELLDAAELQRRTATANWQRIADGKSPLPADNRLLAAMHAGLPPCTGVALGFDRLVMLAANATSLAEVMAFPVDRA